MERHERSAFSSPVAGKAMHAAFDGGRLTSDAGILVLDNGPIHTSGLTTGALAERPWFTVEWLPKHAPELNDIERSWRDLKRHHLAHRTFRGADDLDAAIHDAVAALNHERRTPACAIIPKAA